MERALREGGKRLEEVIGLAVFVHTHESAVRADLLGAGLHLRDVGTERLSWAELDAFIRWLPAASATVRSVNPDSEWTLEAHLLASIFDANQALIWQNGGGKGKRPQPLSRPGTKGFVGQGADAAAAALQSGGSGATKFGTADDIDVIAARLGFTGEMAEAAARILADAENN